MGKTTELWISPDLSFPVDVVTETLLIIAKRGSGKTHTASVLVEEMIAAGLPVCVIDPIGVWWGLRSNADGTGPGLPVAILGGEHADLPLPAESGALVADLIIDERIPVVIDLSGLSKTQQRRFVCDFMERLYHRNRDPLHLVVDEADLFAPLRGSKESARPLGAYEDIVRRGRARGLGCTSITQRPAVLHTDIRSQAEVLIALRLIGTHDVAAIDEWVRLHATDEEAREVKASLPSLPVGTAWVWSPGWLEILARVKIRQRLTFDSSATPKVGQQRRTATISDIDVGALRARLAAVVDQAEKDDPVRLRRRVAELERKLAARQPQEGGQLTRLGTEVNRLTAELAAERAKPPVRVPVLADGDIPALQHALDRVGEALATARAIAQSPVPTAVPAPHRPVPAVAPAPVRTAPAGEPAGEPVAGSGTALPKAQRAILTVLAQFPDGRSKKQVATLSRYSASSGGFNGALAGLRSAGLISRGDPMVITDPGRAALGEWEPLPSGAALVEHWMGVLSKAEGAVLRLLLDSWPAPMSKDGIAAAAGYSANSGGFNGALARLRTLQLITGGAAGMLPDETLAEQAREYADA